MFLKEYNTLNHCRCAKIIIKMRCESINFLYLNCGEPGSEETFCIKLNFFHLVLVFNNTIQRRTIIPIKLYLINFLKLVLTIHFFEKKKKLQLTTTQGLIIQFITLFLFQRKTYCSLIE